MLHASWTVIGVGLFLSSLAAHPGAAQLEECSDQHEKAQGDILLQSWQHRYRSKDAAHNVKELLTGASPPSTGTASNVSQNISFWNMSIPPLQQPFVTDSLMAATHDTVACMILGVVGFVSILVFLVNYPDPDIRHASWQFLSRTVCICSAVLVSKSTTKVALSEILHSLDASEHNFVADMSAIHDPIYETSFKAIALSFSCWLSFWIMFQVYLLFYRGTHIVAISRLGGHIVAFAGLDAFTCLQSGEAPLDILRKTPVNSIVCAMSVAVVMWLVLELAESGRKYFVNRRSDPKKYKDWFHECREAESEAASLIIGLLLSQTIRHCISGEHPPLHGGKPKSKSNNQIFLLLFIAVGLAAIVVRLEILLKKVLNHADSPGLKKGLFRFIRIVVDTVSMTMAWCLLYWGEWFIYKWTNDRGVGHGDRMTALLVVAAVLSGLCMAGIFIIVGLSRRFKSDTHKHGLHALGVALGMVVGCAWEDVFIEAVGGVKSLNFLKLKQSYSTLILIFLLCVVTIPVWIFYILPKAQIGRLVDSDDDDPEEDSQVEDEGVKKPTSGNLSS